MSHDDKSPLVFFAPTTVMVVGSSGTGKTSLVSKILLGQSRMFDTPPIHIYYHYGVFQEGFELLEQKIPNITFISGLPTESHLENIFLKKVHQIIVIDDLMNETLSDDTCEQLFLKNSSHNYVTVIYMSHNLFCPGRYARSIFLNCKEFILFRNMKDLNQVKNFSRRLGHSQAIMDAYKDAVSLNHGYLHICLDERQSDVYMLRTNITDSNPIIYLYK